MSIKVGLKSASEIAVQGGQHFDLKESFTIDTNNGADTYYGEWSNIGAYNELIANLKFTAAANRNDETINVSVVRENGHGDEVEVVAFTEYAAQGAAHTEEKSATSLLGLKIRLKIVAAGTFGATVSFTFAVKGTVKKV